MAERKRTLSEFIYWFRPKKIVTGAMMVPLIKAIWSNNNFFLNLEADNVTPASHTVAVTFRKAFSAAPAGITNLKVYRMGQFIAGKYGPKEVQWYMTAPGKLTATGFEIEIEAAESLTGVIVEYLFYEKR